MRNFGISRLLGKRVRFLQERGPWWTSHITRGWPHTHAYKDWTQWALKRRHALGLRMWPGVPEGLGGGMGWSQSEYIVGMYEILKEWVFSKGLCATQSMSLRLVTL